MHVLVRLLADGTLVLLAGVAAYALVWRIPRGQRFEAYCRIIMAGLTAYLAAKLIASIYQPAHERPFELLGTAAGALYLQNAGFPSDHALFAMFLTLAVWFETKSRKLTFIMAVLTVLMGVGRVLALVHTPLDIIGGIVIACVGALWYGQRSTETISHQTLAKKTKS